MAAPTHDEMLFLVRKRYPNIEATQQTWIAAHALVILTEPQWVKVGITPEAAVKLASHRSKRPSIAVQ